MLAGVLVICIVMPIVVASAVGTGEPEGQGGMTVVDSQVEQLAAGEEQQQDAVPVVADRSAEETTGTAAPEATATPVATAEALNSNKLIFRFLKFSFTPAINFSKLRSSSILVD